MRSGSKLFLLAAGLLVNTSALAAPFQPEDWSVFEKEASASHTAEYEMDGGAQVPRVRIPLTIRGFERVPAAANGTSARGARDVTIPRRPQDFNLRARIDRPNHFYFGDWHVETIPGGKTEAGELKMRLSLSRTFGEDHELEEHVGDLDVQGGLSRLEPGLFGFNGKAGSRFQGRNGDLAAEIQINGGKAAGASFPGRVSRLEPLDAVKPVNTTPVR
jgi:hypothetical protein